MNRQASILFNIILSSSSGNYLALQGQTAPRSYYQRLIYSLLSRSIHTKEGFESLGRQLADTARHAYLARQMDAVEQASQIMLALPISSHLRIVAQHYQALCTKQKRDYEGARRLLEGVVEEATPQYRARALQVTGATYHEQGELDAALQFYVAAGKAAIDCDLLTVAESQRNIAVVRSIHGDHKQALKDIENLFPLFRVIAGHYPALYYDYLNSLAVELGEVGHIAEAEAACAIALASPFSAAYPNWSETRDEIEAKRARVAPFVVTTSVGPAPSPQLAHNLKRVRSLAIIYPARDKSFVQISSAIVATLIAQIEIHQSILDRLRCCINPRGPPARF